MDIVKECKPCAIFNEEQKIDFNYPLITGKAFERVGIDTLGPLVQTEAGNNFILKGIDYLTKYVVMSAVKDKRAETVANFILNKIILEHGCPAVLLTDNGLEYNNELFKILCNRLGINKKYSSPYRPQTNGLIERTNKTLVSILAKTRMQKR